MLPKYPISERTFFEYLITVSPLTVQTSGQQYELLDWLANVTFPTEAKFQDVEFAKRMYKKVVRTFIDAGVSYSLFKATSVLTSST